MNSFDQHSGPRPRILFIASDLASGGGVNRVIRDLAVLLKGDLGVDVRVVNARSCGTPSYEFPATVEVEHHRKQLLLAYFRLLLRLRRMRPDFVVSSWTQDNILVTLAFLWSRSKVIAVEHSPWHFHNTAVRALRRLVYPLAWRVVVLNRRDLEHYRAFLDGVRLIPNPITAHPSPRRKAKREKLILAIGHLEPLKQFDHAVRAMAQSGLSDEGWSLTIIGSGSCEKELRDLVASLGLSAARFIPGGEDLAEHYRRASMLIVTSRIESFSLVLAEGMAEGVVPLAYGSDGPSMILEDFPHLLVAPGDLSSLAGRLGQLARSPELDTIRPRLVESVRRNFSPHVVSALWKDLLSEPHSEEAS